MLRSFSPLLHQDNSHVQLLSIRLLQEVMELLAEEGTQPLETQVHQSLVPLFLHGHDENQCVAEVSTWGLWVPHGRVLGCLLPRCLKGSNLLLALAQGCRCCALGCGAMSLSLLLCRPLGMRSFVPQVYLRGGILSSC